MAPPQRFACTVDEIVAHGERVYTVGLRAGRTVPRFRPGQFLHLALDRYDPSGFWPESRAFSIASSPSERERVRLTYSVQGRFTARLEEELRPGREVWIKMPYGDFVIDGAGEVVLCAGGTGITAFTAFLEQVQAASGQTVTVAYGARREDLLVYRDLVERSAQRTGSVSALYFVEQDEAAGCVPGVLPGRVAIAPIWPRLRQPLDARYLISGPPAMLRALEADLRSRHVPPESIRTDAWE